MPCTTILVGKNASYDGSTLVARNEDSSNGVFEPKRMRVVHPDEQPRVYTSVLSHLTVELPNNPMRYTSVPDVVPGHGIWAEAGFNELNVGTPASRLRTRPAWVEAQKRQPIRQPTWVETQTVLP